MTIIERAAIEAMEQRYRARFINSLSGFKSANLVGTASIAGSTNLAIVSSVFHLGAAPPLMGMIVRPHTTARHTLENIIATGSYTLNHVSKHIYAAAHQTSARYPQACSEFDAVGLNTLAIEGCHAPAVAEARLSIALELREIKHLDINKTELVIGEITHVRVPDEAIAEDGFVDIEALDTVAVSGLDCYHTTERLNRLEYAKPDQPVKAIKPGTLES